ncbi:histidine kinase [Paenibacillus sp. YN15]|uniref:sensor histidine kinase n=1 Tax=Paenibacillus sp. YN15 TaxID=1742774 RepID=UPI0015EB7245|nr:histidine kinase [Paenibacillus sp. YN15]
MGIIRKLKIKYQLMIILLVLLSIVCSIFLLALQVSFLIYDKQLYQQLERSLNLSVSDIQNEMDNMEKLSLTVALDYRIQEQLQLIQKTSGTYENVKELEEFRNTMMVYLLSEKYLSSIRFVGHGGYEFAAGQDNILLDDRLKREALERAALEKGGMAYVEPSEHSPYVLGAREVLSIRNTSLEDLGTLLLQLNLAPLVEKHFGEVDDRSNLYILSDGRLLYSWGNDRRLTEADLAFPDKQGYRIAKAGGWRYFVAYTTSDATGWTYTTVLPYDYIFSKKIQLRNVLFLVFAVLFVSAIYTSYRFAHTITKPIEALASSMRIAESGDFQQLSPAAEKQMRTDEVGYLQRRFTVMIQRIQYLIRENYEKQLALKDTEYKALQAQINPHFLYNTLSSINWMARRNDQTDISKMVEALSRLLRISISEKASVISLGEEADILRDYMHIQQIRYTDRLAFRIMIPAGYDNCPIPKLTLQPIVENAIKHGVEMMLEPCCITVQAMEEENALCIVITDNGPGMDEETVRRLNRFEYKSQGTGIGLKNIHERLQLLFGADYGIHCDSSPGGGTAVTVRLPKEGLTHAEGIIGG